MEKKTSFFLRLPTLLCSLLLLTFSAAVFRAFRINWVFFDPNLRFMGGARGLFCVIAAFLLLSLALLCLRTFGGKETSKKRVLRVLGAVTFVAAVLFALALCVMLFVAGAESDRAVALWLKKDLPFVFAFLLAVAALAVLPNLRGRGKAALAAALALILGIAGLTLFFPLTPYKIAADPVVMDTGKDYAVVFATNDRGTGFVTYTYEGEERTVPAEKHGRLIGDRLIHSVHVPYEHLNGNAYVVGSTRVIGEWSYGGFQGKTVTKGPYTLQVNESETQRYLLLSDWHTFTNAAKKAAAKLGDFDALVLLGDPAPGMDFEEEAVQYLVRFAGDLSGGTKPVYWVRGNHETRGAFADDLPDFLGYETCYYTARRGDYAFLVLDSGEDKPDSHIEYGGMDAYERQRKEQIDWLKTLKKDGGKLVVFSHAWQFSQPEKEVSLEAWRLMDGLGASFVVSGHVHVRKLMTAADDGAPEQLLSFPDMRVFIDGGHRGKHFVASMMTLSPDGVLFTSANDLNDEILKDALPWR